MNIFVFCVNLIVAVFILAVVAEISTLLIGSLVYALEWWKARVNNGT